MGKYKTFNDYENATFQEDKSGGIQIICPYCKKLFAREEEPFLTDEIGECIYCHIPVYIPWEQWRLYKEEHHEDIWLV